MCSKTSQPRYVYENMPNKYSGCNLYKLYWYFTQIIMIHLPLQYETYRIRQLFRRVGIHLVGTYVRTHFLNIYYFWVLALVISRFNFITYLHYVVSLQHHYKQNYWMILNKHILTKYTLHYKVLTIKVCKFCTSPTQ